MENPKVDPTIFDVFRESQCCVCVSLHSIFCSVHAQRKELKEFTRDVAVKNEDKALKPGNYMF